MKLPFQVDLKGKVAVVTGAGGVLCSMFSEAIAACGAKVALLDINQEAAGAVADKIVGDGGIAKAYKADVLSKESLEGVHAQVVKDFGRCDILLNGAGGYSPKATTTNEYLMKEDLGAEDIISFFNLDKAGVEFVFNLNFLGTLLPTQVFAKDMAEAGCGNIINVSSMNSFTPLTKIPAYSGAKAAVSNFTKWLSVHFSKVGVRVNAIAPGFFVTNQNRALLLNADGSYTERSKKILNHTPMGRFGEAEELIGSVLFLLCEEASGFVNGVVIPIDGGFSSYTI